MSLLAQRIWWQVYPLAACGAPILDREPNDSARRLTKLLPWLDYAAELGCSGLIFGPIFESTAHGYDTLDHFKLDARLGTLDDWQQLVTKANQLDLPIILDGVFNHVGLYHPAVEQGDIIKTEDGHPYHWEGMQDLVELDHSDPEVVRLVIDVMKYWLGQGAAGWRLDVAYAVPTSFWAEVTAAVRQDFPDAVFIGEMIHGDYPKFVTEAGLDTVTQYELWKAIWSSIKDGNMFELAHALGRHQEFCQTMIPQIFVGNHDVDRIASKVGKTGAKVAAAILLTVPGSPSIYYGDEQGVLGEKGEGVAADMPLRPELPQSPWPPTEITNAYRELLSFRRANQWIAQAKLEVIETTNPALHYRVNDDDHELHVKIDLASEPVVQLTCGAQEIMIAS